MSLPNNIVFKSLGYVVGTLILFSVILMITTASTPIHVELVMLLFQ